LRGFDVPGPLGLHTPRFMDSEAETTIWEIDATLIDYKEVDWVWNIVFSPDGRTLASASKNATLKLWDATDGREMMTLNHPQWVNGAASSPDGTRLATADDDKFVRLWNPLTGQNLSTLSGHDAVVECVTVSPDGKLLASGGKTGEIKLWDAATGSEVATLHASYQNIIWSLAFSPDGKYLAAGEGGMEAFGLATGHLVTVWDISSRQIVKALSGHANDVRAVAFSPDGKFLVSGSFDDTIRFWDLASWQQIVTLKTDKVQSLAFSADGKRLVSGGRDKTVKLWDVATRQERCTLTVPSEIESVAFSPDNKVLAAASNDGKVRLWFGSVQDGRR
jgi:WD40 repeat protein